MELDSLATLPLDASLTLKVKNLTTWHVGLVDRFPSSFALVGNLFASNAILSTYDLSSIEAFLVRSFVRNLSRFEKRLFEHEVASLINWVEEAPVGSRIRPRPDAVLHAIEEFEKQMERKKLELSSSRTLLELIDDSLNTLNPRASDIVRKRLGINTPKLTLETIAQIYGITRERVRQIANKGLSRVERFQLWDDIFRDKLNQLFAQHSPAILIDDLGVFDQWFQGFSFGEENGKNFLETFAPDFGLLVVNSNSFFCRKDDQPLLEQLALGLIHAPRAGEMTAEEIAKIDELYASLGVYEQDHYLRKKLEGFVAESKIRPSIGAICTNLLDTTFDPVDFVTVLTEAIRHGYAKEDVNPRTVQHALASSGIVIARSPAAYVSKKSIGIDSEIIMRFCDRVFNFCSEDFEPGFVFHATQVVSWNAEISLGIDLGENEWLAVALLQMDEKRRFRSNKLKFWLTRDFGTGSPEFTIFDLVRRVLKINGRPMSSRLIASEVSKYQYLSPTFQIHPKDDLIFLGQGYYSLEEFQHEEPLSHDTGESYLEDFVRDCLESSNGWISASYVIKEHSRVMGVSPSNSSVQNALRRNGYLVDGPPAKFSSRKNLGLTSYQISYVCDCAYLELKENFSEGYHAHSEQLIKWIGNKIELPAGRNLITAVLKADLSNRFIVGRAMFSLKEASEDGEVRSFKNDAYSVLSKFDNEMPLHLFDKSINKMRFWSEKDRLGIYSAGLSIRDGVITRNS